MHLLKGGNLTVELESGPAENSIPPDSCNVLFNFRLCSVLSFLYQSIQVIVQHDISLTCKHVSRPSLTGYSVVRYKKFQGGI